MSGYLATTTDEFVERVIELLESPVRAKELGTEGARRVRERFLIPRLLRDKLTLIKEALGA